MTCIEVSWHKVVARQSISCYLLPREVFEGGKGNSDRWIEVSTGDVAGREDDDHGGDAGTGC